MSRESKKVRGPLGIRLLIWAGTGLLTLLFIWAIGYMLKDVGGYQYVDREEMRKEFVPEALDDEVKEVRMAVEDLQREIGHVKERLDLTKEDLESTREVTLQMQDSEVLAMLQDRDASGQFLDLVAESQRSFQEATRQRHELVARMQDLQEQRHTQEVKLTDLERQVAEKEEALQEKIDEERERRGLIAGALKLLVLLPLVAVAGWLLARKRRSRFAPMIYAFGVAVLVQLLGTIRQHFPDEVFNYILVGGAIVFVIIILRKLIQSVWQPARETLLKRYRQAYEKNECGVCGHPIRWNLARMTTRALTGSRFASVTLPPEAVAPGDQPYTCPACGTHLFEDCSNCGEVRHSLLPQCRHCGAEKDLPGAEPEPARGE